MRKYSVVVPVFNNEDTICDCLNSILKQPYQNIEVIVVNDGSTDNTEKICKSFLKDNRVFYIYQQNSGVSVTRNVGLSYATGDYVLFVDADDKVEANFIVDICDFTEDLIIFNFKKEISEDCFESKEILDGVLSNNETVFYKLFSEKLLNIVWGKAFCLDVIKNNRLCFEEDLDYSEDTVFACSFFFCIKTVRIVNKANYIYRVGANQSLSKITDGSFKRKLKSFERLKIVCDRKYTGFSKSDVFRLKVYKSYLQEIYYILQSKKSYIDKYRDLKFVYGTNFIQKNGKYLSQYIEHDKSLVRLINEGNIFKLLAFYRVAELRHKVNK